MMLGMSISMPHAEWPGEPPYCGFHEERVDVVVAWISEW